MGLLWSSNRGLSSVLVLLWLCVWSARGSEVLPADELEGDGQGNFTVKMEVEERLVATTEADEGKGSFGTTPEVEDEAEEQQVTAPTPPGGVFVLKLRVVDSLTSAPLSSASVVIFVNFTETDSAQTQENGEVWFRITHRASAVISAVVSKQRYVPALLPVATDDIPVFSSVTVALLGLNRGNMWLFNDSVIVTTKSTGVVGSQPVVEFPRSALTLTDENALSAVTVFINSPSLCPAEGAVLYTVGILNTTSGLSPVDLSPVASAFVQLLSSSSSSSSTSSSSSEELNVDALVSLSLPVCESCGVQEGDHVPAWTFNHTHGAWVRRGLGTVQLVDGRLVWTFAAPHLGHWMAAPLSPSRGIRLDQHVDFLLRHGSFLMILLGSTLTVAVCLLVGLLCCPRSQHKETKMRRPAVNPLFSVKDQSTSTCEDHVILTSNGQYNVALYDPGVITNPNVEFHHQNKEKTADYPEQQLHNQTQNLGNGFFFYNQPVAILHAPAFFQMDETSEQQWSKSTSLPDDVTQNKITNEEPMKKEVKKKPDVQKPRPHAALPESVSEPGTLGINPAVVSGPRAWFVSLEGKPAAEIRYAVSEEPQRCSRDTSLDSGLDLTEPGQAKRDSAKLERNATFLKKSSKQNETPGH